MPWKIISTKGFSKNFKKLNKDGNFINAIEKKIQRLKENPGKIGGHLSGRLHGCRSTRIIRKLRLVFKIDEGTNSVFLIGIDHRKFNYGNF